MPGVGIIGLALTILALALALRADQGPPAQGAAPRPLVPMTASTIARNPEAHLGQNVSMMATVEAVLSKTAFTVDQDRTKSTGQDVLVLAPTLTVVPDLNAYVTVQGEVMRFDPAEIAKKARNYTVDLSPELVAKYQGKTVVLATVVLTPALVDLAKRPIPPMTPAEVTFSGWMKTIQPAFTAVRGGLEAPDAAQLKEQLAALKKAFTEVEAFFKGRKTEGAVKWSGDALKAVAAMEQGLASGKLDELKASAGSLQQLCTACHTQHRERMEDGTFRFKDVGSAQ